jgi:hypothetical protein
MRRSSSSRPTTPARALPRPSPVPFTAKGRRPSDGLATLAGVWSVDVGCGPAAVGVMTPAPRRAPPTPGGRGRSRPQTADPLLRHARGGAACATAGRGPALLVPAAWLSHLELASRDPAVRAFYAPLAAHRTVVRYDKPGCGLSDPWPGPDARDRPGGAASSRRPCGKVDFVAHAWAYTCSRPPRWPRRRPRRPGREGARARSTRIQRLTSVSSAGVVGAGTASCSASSSPGRRCCRAVITAA